MPVPQLDDLAGLLPDWRRHLRATNKAPSTITSYLRCAENLLSHLTDRGMPTTASGIHREHLEAFLADLLLRCSPATTAKHYRSLQQLWRWLEEDCEIAASPMARMRPPAVPEQPVPVPSDDDLQKLVDACRDKTFENKRDLVMVRLLLDTGVLASELMGLAVDDVDLEQGMVVVLGKGRRARAVPFGARTAQDLGRYLRARRSHPMASSSALFIGRRGPLGDSGLRQVLDRRCADAGIGHLNPHAFWHFFAHSWLANGGLEGDLMALAGWRSREMLTRYARSAASSRAVAAHKRAGLGDRF